ncbi:MAG: hypothetical protein KGJ49_03730 [Alphaproteobacteria bacterium]|nr:hypothetical protein [Alphaproteobacteria bacterium]
MTRVQGAVTNVDAVSGGNGAGDAVSLWRLYVLRALYVIIAVGQGSIQVPAFLHHAHWTQTSAVAHSFLLALALLSIVGIRYPLGMLPLLVYELLWKMIWLCGIALPLWAANQVDADTRESFFEIAPIIILFPLLPWGYIFSNYLKKPGDRWR